MKIEYTPVPTNEDVDFLTQKINQETSAFGTAYPFGFFIRDDKGDIIGGCNGFVIFGEIYTDQLWVRHDYRKQGVGRKLMERVHEKGREVGCKMATVETMSFQGAQEFYKNLGYKIDFERSGYPKDSRCMYLSRTI